MFNDAIHRPWQGLADWHYLMGQLQVLLGEVLGKVSEAPRISEEIYSLQIVKHIWYHVHNSLATILGPPAHPFS